MEYIVTRTSDDELQHHGTKGMKWGRRLYQNKDGSLTPLGQKRYNKEVEKLKKETAKVKEAEKVAATRKKTQTKLDKLEEKKAKLEERKKALKDGKDPDKDDQPTETPEQRRERALKSTDPKEVYENRHLLSDQELMSRVNRIDLEMRLNSKVPAEEHKKTGLEYVDSARNAIDKTTNLFRSVDNAYSAVSNSAVGKTLAKQLGIELAKNKEEVFDLDDFVKNINKKSDQELANKAKRVKNHKTIVDALNSAGNTNINNATNNIDMDAIRSYVDDAIDDALNNRNGGN